MPQTILLVRTVKQTRKELFYKRVYRNIHQKRLRNPLTDKVTKSPTNSPSQLDDICSMETTKPDHKRQEALSSVGIDDKREKLSRLKRLEQTEK